MRRIYKSLVFSSFKIIGNSQAVVFNSCFTTLIPNTLKKWYFYDFSCKYFGCLGLTNNIILKYFKSYKKGIYFVFYEVLFSFQTPYQNYFKPGLRVELHLTAYFPELNSLIITTQAVD